MKILIDSLDYTAFLDAEKPASITRQLNAPSIAEFALVIAGAAPAVPARSSRVKVQRNDSAVLFAGYVAATPEFEYLGYGPAGPVFRYAVHAQSDEFLLDQRAMPELPTYVNRTAGDSLRRLTDALAPGEFDLSGVSDVEGLPALLTPVQAKWSTLAAQLAAQSRSAYRAEGGAITLKPVGTVTHALSESAPGYEPEGLRTQVKDDPINDVVATGFAEAGAQVKDYFLGDGLSYKFYLSHPVFHHTDSVAMEEEFRDASLDAHRWNTTDPAAAMSASSGALQFSGGTGVDGGTTLAFTEQLELCGALVLEHGEFAPTAPCTGIIGGVYGSAVNAAGCIAGFRLTPSAGQTIIQPIINGGAAGTAITTSTGKRYALKTRIFADEQSRTQSTFHSSTHPAGSGRGGTAIASAARFVLEVHTIDPSDPGSLQTPSSVLYDGSLSSLPSFCTYAPANAADLHGSMNFVRIVKTAMLEVRSTIPGGSPRTRLVGSVVEGAECQVSTAGTLGFYSATVPVANEAIVARYRGSSRTLARLQDSASIAALASGNDSGLRTRVLKVDSPAALTSVDCENAALALLDDSTQPACTGSYECWSSNLPSGPTSDPRPGDAFAVSAPSRGPDVSGVIRRVQLTLQDLWSDHSRYRIDFANEADSPIALAVTGERMARLPDPIVPGGGSFVDGLPDAEMTSLTSTTVSIDAGYSPPGGWGSGAGFGIEVRRSDTDWNAADDRNLIGRFSAQTFTLPRLTRTQTYYLRLFTNGPPHRYSRYSTVIHLDYPL